VSLIDKTQIQAGVLNMLSVNMGVKAGESILVVGDPPTLPNWAAMGSDELERMLERSLLAKAVAEIAAAQFPANRVEFYAYPAVARSGAEPIAELGERMAAADVVIAITNRSLSHTDARQNACRAGARVASMPGFMVRMFAPQGPMNADYREVERLSLPVARRLTQATQALVRSSVGTDIRVSQAGREAIADTGLFVAKGSFGNLPAGESFIAPLEGTAEGQIVVEPGWARGLTELLTIRFQHGLVSEVLGGGGVGDNLRRLLGFAGGEIVIERRNLAELGVGTNPMARPTESTLEAEKVMGTVHIAIGDNAHIGGAVTADLHMDFVLPHSELILDGDTVMSGGRLRVAS
jgi:leucyl aminopeptidase (aminopeptidase T)